MKLQYQKRNVSLTFIINIEKKINWKSGMFKYWEALWSNGMDMAKDFKRTVDKWKIDSKSSNWTNRYKNVTTFKDLTLIFIFFSNVQILSLYLWVARHSRVVSKILLFTHTFFVMVLSLWVWMSLWYQWPLFCSLIKRVY